MTFLCAVCREPINPTAPFNVCRRVTGWEYKAPGPSRRGGSDVLMREPQDEWAHKTCLEHARDGISPKQQAML